MPDELVDILDKTGKPTGEIRLKSEAHTLGLYHASVHIWFYANDGKVLFQKRADNKDTFPSLWDVSVAGHIGTGESAENSAIREIQEEIGLDITKDYLEFIGVYLAEKTPTPDLLDNEFHHIFLAELRTPLEQLSLQKEEVSEIKLITIEAFEQILSNDDMAQKYVPHDSNYLALIIKEIKNRLA